MRLLLTGIIAVLLSVNHVLAIEAVYIPQPRSNLDIGHEYHTSLLKKALIHGANGRAIPIIKTSLHMPEARANYEVTKGEKVDVYWFGTDAKKERDMRAIRIPTSKGLIGYRRFIIHKDSIEKFDNIASLLALKQQTACLGAHWPDIRILQASDLPVVVNTMYENIFKRVHAKRCDYFPRAYHDGYNEVSVRKNRYPNLVHYEKIVLHYPFAVYFFTPKSKETLAAWIEDGLNAMIENGEFLRHMQSHLLTAHIFPLEQSADVRYINIPNPSLPEDTDWKNKKYWFQPSDFGFAENKKPALN
ncbi:hypothetical protein [Catenovulum sediminis]|uniref:Solute-binding protein family 3/N-terminal domain-containing protein n=1 Tax=Catenovulum sediminis TaxID=1740262 RepID=A0ABV1RHS6_9ALTE